MIWLMWVQTNYFVANSDYILVLQVDISPMGICPMMMWKRILDLLVTESKLWYGVDPYFWLVLNLCPRATILEVALVNLLLVPGRKPFTCMVNCWIALTISKDLKLTPMYSQWSQSWCIWILPQFSPPFVWVIFSASVEKGFGTHSGPKSYFGTMEITDWLLWNFYSLPDL